MTRLTDYKFATTATLAAAYMVLAGQDPNLTSLPNFTSPHRENVISALNLPTSFATGAGYLVRLSDPLPTLLSDRTAQNMGSFVITDSNPSRPTTAAEKAIAELRAWKRFNENWDGEESAKPSHDSIAKAIAFIFSMPPNIQTPEPMLHSNGRTGLFWEHPNLYADLEFYPDGRVTYFVRDNQTNQCRGVVRFDNKTIPSVLKTLLEEASTV